MAIASTCLGSHVILLADTVCQALSNCTTFEYLVDEATKTSDRRCADLTVCQEGVTYQTQPPAEPTRPNPAYRFIADRTCGAVATCTASQYILTPEQRGDTELFV